MKVLVSCPPMLGMIGELRGLLREAQFDVTTPAIVQTLSEEQLVELLPGHDGWIAGDDPATRRVLAAGAGGRLRSLVKWGIGTDNVDFAAARDLGLKVSNTPQMFGHEVADVAMAYVTALARELFVIDRGVRRGQWPKPQGISLQDKTIGIVGFGDIGSKIGQRASAAGMRVIAYDPRLSQDGVAMPVCLCAWPAAADEWDFLVLTCPLTDRNRHMIDDALLARTRAGLRLVNVARGPLVDERALIRALETGRVHSAALDVMEDEPLPATSPLRHFERCIFGSHNGSNTREAVLRASGRAINQMRRQLEEA